MSLGKYEVTYSTKPSPTNDGFKYIQHFDNVAPISKDVIISGAYSSASYTGEENYKAKDKYVSSYSNVIILDIDDGFKLSEVGVLLQKYKYFLATTKSHMKPKTSAKIIADRFRIVLFLDKVLGNVHGKLFANVVKAVAMEVGLYNYIDIGASTRQSNKFDPSPGDSPGFYFREHDGIELNTDAILDLAEQLMEEESLGRKIIDLDNRGVAKEDIAITLANDAEVMASDFRDTPNTTRCYCPFGTHTDSKPSAFVFSNGTGVKCSSCGQVALVKYEEKKDIIETYKYINSLPGSGKTYMATREAITNPDKKHIIALPTVAMTIEKFKETVSVWNDVNKSREGSLIEVNYGKAHSDNKWFIYEEGELEEPIKLPAPAQFKKLLDDDDIQIIYVTHQTLIKCKEFLRDRDDLDTKIVIDEEIIGIEDIHRTSMDKNNYLANIARFCNLGFNEETYAKDVMNFMDRVTASKKSKDDKLTAAFSGIMITNDSVKNKQEVIDNEVVELYAKAFQKDIMLDKLDRDDTGLPAAVQKLYEYLVDDNYNVFVSKDVIKKFEDLSSDSLQEEYFTATAFLKPLAFQGLDVTFMIAAFEQTGFYHAYKSAGVEFEDVTPPELRDATVGWTSRPVEIHVAYGNKDDNFYLSRNFFDSTSEIKGKTNLEVTLEYLQNNVCSGLSTYYTLGSYFRKPDSMKDKTIKDRKYQDRFDDRYGNWTYVDNYDGSNAFLKYNCSVYLRTFNYDNTTKNKYSTCFSVDWKDLENARNITKCIQFERGYNRNRSIESKGEVFKAVVPTKEYADVLMKTVFRGYTNIEIIEHTIPKIMFANVNEKTRQNAERWLREHNIFRSYGVFAIELAFENMKKENPKMRFTENYIKYLAGIKIPRMTLVDNKQNFERFKELVDHYNETDF